MNARKIAAEDRRASLEQAKLILDLELLARLLENFNRGGSTDREETSRMGAEALTLIGMLGSEHLPELWAQRVDHEGARLVDLVNDPEFPEWKREAIQVQLAVNAASKRVRELIERR